MDAKNRRQVITDSINLKKKGAPVLFCLVVLMSILSSLRLLLQALATASLTVAACFAVGIINLVGAGAVPAGSLLNECLEQTRHDLLLGQG